MIKPIDFFYMLYSKGKITYEDLQTCRLFDITLKELEESMKKEKEEKQSESIDKRQN